MVLKIILTLAKRVDKTLFKTIMTGVNTTAIGESNWPEITPNTGTTTADL